MSTRARPHTLGEGRRWPARIIAAGIVAGLVFFNIALISLNVAAVPVRGVLAIGVLGLLGLLVPELLASSARRNAGVMLLAGALAALGVFVSLVNGVGVAAIGRALLEVHVQAVITVLLGTMLAALAGPRATVLAFCAAVGASALVALVQFAGIETGWSLREAFGAIQKHALGEDSSFVNRRPMGLSYSPIHLATQACLAFAGFAALRLWVGRAGAHEGAPRIDWAMLAALAAMVAVAFLSQTRSPIVGALVFLGLYLLWHGSAFHRLLILAGAAALLLAAPMILDVMQGAESRVFRVGDNSSSGRYTLATYGLMLMADNPLGYGFGFVSQDHWQPYWTDLYTLPGAGEVREAELHNYLLNMMTTYGIGLLLVCPLAVHVLLRARRWVIAFVPYVVHMAFHNTGPFWNVTLFWFVVGAIAVMAVSDPAPVRPRVPRSAPLRTRSLGPHRA